MNDLEECIKLRNDFSYFHMKFYSSELYSFFLYQREIIPLLEYYNNICIIKPRRFNFTNFLSQYTIWNLIKPKNKILFLTSNSQNVMSFINLLHVSTNDLKQKNNNKYFAKILKNNLAIEHDWIKTIAFKNQSTITFKTTISDIIFRGSKNFDFIFVDEFCNVNVVNNNILKTVLEKNYQILTGSSIENEKYLTKDILTLNGNLPIPVIVKNYSDLKLFEI